MESYTSYASQNAEHDMVMLCYIISLTFASDDSARGGLRDLVMNHETGPQYHCMMA